MNGQLEIVKELTTVLEDMGVTQQKIALIWEQIEELQKELSKTVEKHRQLNEKKRDLLKVLE